MSAQAAVSVLAADEQLAAVLSPIRRRILALLREPDSASGLATRLGITRQKANYHLRALEAAGLVELVEERKRRGCIERIVRASARSYVVNPAGPGPDQPSDRRSTDALLAASSRTISDVAILRERADATGKRLATLTIDGEVLLASAKDFAAFGEEVARAVEEIADRYRRKGGRRFRFTTGLYPVITKTPNEAAHERRTT